MNNRLYVGNLSFNTDSALLESAFAVCGEVVEAKIIMDRDTGRSRGFGFVTMSDPEAAAGAVTRLDGTMVDGRPLRVNIAEERQANRGGGGGRRW